jgi:hypothetical protein
MATSTIPDSFCLYLWRSPELPGTLYLAENFDAAEALCRGLTEDGYTVKVIHVASNAEFELSAGKLCPPKSLGRTNSSREPQATPTATARRNRAALR